ncbi:hypothetical protein ACFW9X_41585 [Streptomyces sp. NPDC059466]|uniref:hypothetical protein n=1 Tax=Streptomyces sp. NPDC059466 TaxID=3346843 RepID=UPI0036D1A2C9
MPTADREGLSAAYVVWHGAGAGRAHGGPWFTDVRAVEVTTVKVTTVDEERARSRGPWRGNLNSVRLCRTSL